MTGTADAAAAAPIAGKPWSRHTANKRAAILQSAVRVFVRDGFDAARVEDIAAIAGVGKQTVYNYFGHKDKLFLAAIRQAEDVDEDSPVGVHPALALSIADDPLEVLRNLGIQILHAVLEPDRAALHRLTIAELGRHPELQQMWSDTAGGDVTEMLAGYLAAATNDGRLAVADPDLVARQFVVLLAGEGRTRSLHGLRALSSAEIDSIAAATAELFISAARTCDTAAPVPAVPREPQRTRGLEQPDSRA